MGGAHAQPSLFASLPLLSWLRTTGVQARGPSRDMTVLGMTCGRTRRFHYVRTWEHRRWVRLPESTIVALCGATIDPRCEQPGEFWPLCEHCDMTHYIPPPPPGELDELNPRTGRR